MRPVFDITARTIPRLVTHVTAEGERTPWPYRFVGGALLAHPSLFLAFAFRGSGALVVR